MALFGNKEPEPVQIGALELHCEICKHDRFWKREAQLNTSHVRGNVFRFRLGQRNGGLLRLRRLRVHSLVPPTEVSASDNTRMNLLFKRVILNVSWREAPWRRASTRLSS